MTGPETSGAGRPVLFLDVDGVLAPTNPPPGAVWADLPPGRTGFDPRVLAGLVDLHARALVRVEWLTTWEQDAARELAPAVGLPAWPVHTRQGAWANGWAGGGSWWKEHVVRAALGRGETVVWVDDDIADRADWLAAAAPDRLLVVCPDPDVGLTVADLAAIGVFVDLSPRR